MTLEQILNKRNKYKGLLIDTNLMLLFIIGSFNINLIQNFNRLKKFSKEDYSTLTKLVSLFTDKILITPHILTELCNLSDSLNLRSDYQIFRFLASLTEKLKEDNTMSLQIINDDTNAFYKFGIADAGVLNLAKQNSLVLTDDLSLYHLISSKGYDVINFTLLMNLYE